MEIHGFLSLVGKSHKYVFLKDIFKKLHVMNDAQENFSFNQT